LASYPATLEALAQILREGDSKWNSKETQQRVWRALEDQLQQQVIGPMLEEAMRTHDPMARSLRVACAHLSRLAHTRAVLAAETISQTIRQGGLERLEKLPRGSVNELLSTVDRLIDLSKEVHRLEESRTIPVPEFHGADRCRMLPWPSSN